MNDGDSPERNVRPDPGEGRRVTGEPAPDRRHRVADRVIGILVGIVLGIAIVVGFVFFGSEETIDAPRIDDATTPARQAPQP